MIMKMNHAFRRRPLFGDGLVYFHDLSALAAHWLKDLSLITH